VAHGIQLHCGRGADRRPEHGSRIRICTQPWPHYPRSTTRRHWRNLLGGNSKQTYTYDAYDRITAEHRHRLHDLAKLGLAMDEPFVHDHAEEMRQLMRWLELIASIAALSIDDWLTTAGSGHGLVRWSATSARHAPPA
jgi:hypothetical protein